MSQPSAIHNVELNPMRSVRRRGCGRDVVPAPSAVRVGFDLVFTVPTGRSRARRRWTHEALLSHETTGWCGRRHEARVVWSCAARAEGSRWHWPRSEVAA
jgi:hypothetical protein